MTAIEYLAGRGIADITGEPAGAGMLGYGKSWQLSDGIQLRLRSRAFVIAHPAITCAIPGTGNPVHLHDNVQGGIGRLPDEAMRTRIARAALDEGR